MSVRELFGRDDVVGIFRGFREGGLEFHADVVLPYRSDFQRISLVLRESAHVVHDVPTLLLIHASLAGRHDAVDAGYGGRTRRRSA